MTSTGGLIGTPDYMSPEQVASGNVDARSDLFAVGAVLYELVAGVKPFTADSITALLMKIMREPHVPLRERAPDLPQGVADLVERLLAKDASDRPSSAREVHEALLALATERPIFDAQTVASLSRAVTEETLRPRTPRPPSRSSVRSAPAARDASSAKLASLALEQGRTLRQAGDLAGAMKVFRSVLELAPGNPEALSELEEMERAFASLTSAPRTASESAAAPAAAAPASALRVTSGLTTADRRGSGMRTAAIVGAAVVLLAAAGGAYLVMSGNDEPVDEAPALAMPALPDAQPSATPAPAAPATVGAAPPPASAAAGSAAAQPAPATSGAAPASPRETARAPRVSTTGSEPPPAEPVAVLAVPVVEPAPAPAPEPPPPPPAEPAAPSAVAESSVRHYHGRSLRRGFSRGYCDGTLQLLADGLYFHTTTSSDGRRDDKKITFGEIDDVEIEDDRLFIEGEEQNWEFGGTKDVLQRVRQHIKANKKEE
jgi:hypothetical protein